MSVKYKQWTLHISLNEEEYKLFVSSFQATICRSKSSYAKRLLLSKPVTVITRNRSLDDFIELGVKIRKELKLLLEKDGLLPEEKEELMRVFRRIEENLIKTVSLCDPR